MRHLKSRLFRAALAQITRFPGRLRPRIPALSFLALAAVFSAPVALLAQTTAYLNFPGTKDGPIPALLSQTGAFSDAPQLTVIPGIVPYEVNQPLWSDGADKFRWIAVPTGTGITFSEKQKWVFPPGTVLIKHFELGAEKHRLETRFEIVTESGGSYFVTYKWRSDNSDADLLDEDSLTETVVLASGRTQKWTYPSRTDCTACHNDSANVVLGPKTRQLNMDAFDPGGNDMRNQLVTWNRLGLFDPPIDENLIATYDALARIDNETRSVEERVRAYLDVNCAICHNATDHPSTAAPFDLHFNTPLAETGIINGPLFISAGVSGGKVIKPQDPTRSLMHVRMSTNQPEERMPPLGRSVVHDEARDLILQWLLSLDPIENLDVHDYKSRWRFDQSLDDVTGLANGAWRNAPPAANFDAGQDEDAVTLDGTSDAVDIGHYDIAGSAFTMALWIFAEELGASEITFLAKASGPAEQDHYWSLSALNQSELRLRLKTNGNTITVTSPPGALTDESWIHIGAVYDGETVRLYKDGDEVASAAVTGAVETDPAVGAAIGNLPAGAGSAPFNGRIDDVRFYERALTPGDFNRVLEAALIDNEEPSVSIDAPDTGLFVVNKTAILFSGTSLDPEDGNLSSDAEWFSGRDGVFGSGGLVNWNKLTVGEHIIVLTSLDDEGVAGSDSIKVTVVPGFTTYIQEFDLFGGDADPFADTDNDRRTQLEEYAFLSHPETGDGSAVRAMIGEEGGGQYLALEFPVSKLAIDLEYVVQYSTDLQNWNDGGSYLPRGDEVLYAAHQNTVPVSATDEGETWRIVERLNGGVEGLAFLRLAIRQR